MVGGSLVIEALWFTHLPTNPRALQAPSGATLVIDHGEPALSICPQPVNLTKGERAGQQAFRPPQGQARGTAWVEREGLDCGGDTLRPMFSGQARGAAKANLQK